jgi:hypothetical protein
MVIFEEAEERRRASDLSGFAMAGGLGRGLPRGPGEEFPRAVVR